MKIGFIGGGHVAQVLASLFINAGHSVVLTNKHGLDRLKPVIQRLGARAEAGNLAEVARQELIVLALPYKAIFELDQTLFNGKAVVDATNYFPHRDGEFEQLTSHQLASSELVAHHFKGAKIVKAFNTIPVANLENLARNVSDDKRIALPIAGDSQVKATVSDLIKQIGFTPYNVGDLKDSLKFQADTPLFLFSGNRNELTAKFAK
ncbi:NAD(P)-binding domain-containing protein [Liquorilactobacillus satsumensis]|uniref:NADPH-dependent F420 reductase n=1 Tax=Liquorilactobacillus satsumensis TaxID=259059 RepID=UPI0021C38A2B|nr:NAD(P)-binding domain-containing protein [Liquorilactobacillus satsumensis]MCP9313554.1 NAD(P)-binding domain-containing protein [Liquorilactobacillus satsumensis]MCP9360680.1 NAD(P)-binding domain-containing protein [Liquorilactobacillus satsumensis]